MNPVILRHPKLVIAALAAVGLFWPTTAESPVGAAALPPIAPVTIERQLIRVPARPMVTKPSKPRVAEGHLRAANPRERTAPAKGLVVRASRLLLGDGRHRPEPFPRPGH
jgi:hypothetical protein